MFPFEHSLSADATLFFFFLFLSFSSLLFFSLLFSSSHIRPARSHVPLLSSLQDVSKSHIESSLDGLSLSRFRFSLSIREREDTISSLYRYRLSFAETEGRAAQSPTRRKSRRKSRRAKAKASHQCKKLKLKAERKTEKLVFEKTRLF